MEVIKIKIARDFTPKPGPRYIKESDIDNSGESFRDRILFPIFKKAIAENKKIEVDLDGTAGYGTSFLEEAFGGLIRVNKLTHEDILSRLLLVSNEEDFLIDDIIQYLKDANDKEDTK